MYFGLPLGGDGPFGPYGGGSRDFRSALEEERGKVAREIREYRSRHRAAANEVAAAAGVKGRGGASSNNNARRQKFDVNLSPRSGRSDLLRLARETLRQCDSVGEVRVVEFNGTDGKREGR